MKRGFSVVFGADVGCKKRDSVAKNGWGRKKLGPDSSLGGDLEEIGFGHEQTSE